MLTYLYPLAEIVYLKVPFNVTCTQGSCKFSVYKMPQLLQVFMEFLGTLI